MWKNRLAYGCLAGILAILLFFSGKSFLLVALLLSLLLIPVFGILIRRDGKRIKIRLEKEKPVAAAIYSKGALRVADRVQIELEVKNEMFDRSECLQFLLPLKGKEQTFFLPVELQLCGQTRFECTRMWVMDLLGLFRIPLKAGQTFYTVLYPPKMRVQMERIAGTVGSSQTDGFLQNRKGNDPSEMFELREYAPGDDIRAIHWKLTSKMDRLIVREYSDSTRYDTIVLYDIALKANGEDVDKTLLSTSIGAVESLSRALVRAGIPHMAAFVFQSRIISAPIAAEADAAEFLYTLLSYPLAENSGIACQFFLAGQIQQNYESMVYFTIHSFPKELALIPADVNLDAVVVTDKDGVPVVTQPARAKVLVEVPVTYLRKNRSFRIIL